MLAMPKPVERNNDCRLILADSVEKAGHGLRIGKARVRD